MRAVVYEGPGNLALKDRPEPRAGDDEILIDVSYFGICGTDLLIWNGGLPRVQPPVVLGHEFCGTVAEGEVHHGGVSSGQRVAVEPLLNCRSCWACRSGNYHVCRNLRLIGVDVDGGAAPRVAVPLERVHPLPDSLDLRAATLTEPLAVAVHMVKRAGVQLGQTVLILGGGPIGALVALVAGVAGAGTVMVSEPDPYRRGVLDEMDIDTVDPTSVELPGLVADLTDGEGVDVLFELAAAQQAVAAAPGLTRVRGTILLGGIFGSPPEVPLAPVTLREQVILGARVYQREDVRDAIRLLDERRVPVEHLITRELSLETALTRGFDALRAREGAMKIIVDVRN